MISTYADLQTNIASWLKRSDLTAAIPTFIQLAEATFNRRLRVLDMEVKVSFNIAPGDVSPGYAPLPDGYSELRSIKIGNRKLTYQTPSILEDIGISGSLGMPRYYTIVANQFLFDCIPDGTYQVDILYLQNIPALSDTNTTNWLLTKHPDLYLYQSLFSTAPWLKNDERLLTWGGILEGIPGSKGLYTQITEDDRNRKYSGAPLSRRPGIMINDGYKGCR